jgi:hypothetical protein
VLQTRQAIRCRRFLRIDFPIIMVHCHFLLSVPARADNLADHKPNGDENDECNYSKRK